MKREGEGRRKPMFLGSRNMEEGGDEKEYSS